MNLPPLFIALSLLLLPFTTALTLSSPISLEVPQLSFISDDSYEFDDGIAVTLRNLSQESGNQVYRRGLNITIDNATRNNTGVVINEFSHIQKNESLLVKMHQMKLLGFFALCFGTMIATLYFTFKKSRTDFKEE